MNWPSHELVRRQEDRFEPTPKAIKRLLGKIGPEMFQNLLLLMQADDGAKRPEYKTPDSVFDEFRKTAAEIIEKNECFSLKNLAVSGADLISAGFEPGKKMGEILDFLLEKVIEGEVQNEKEARLAFAKSKAL